MAVSHPIISGAPVLLAPGFKFRPTDEDIVVHYLRPRAMNVPLPSASIVDVDVLGHNPWDLVPEGSMEKYYFSQRVSRWPRGNRCKRAAGDGHWKASGKDVPIFSNDVNSRVPLVVGLKKTMVFYRGKAPFGENTEWVMQEYSLVEAGLMPCRVLRPRGGSNLGRCGCAAAVIAKKNDELSEALRNATARLDKEPVMVNPDDSWVVCHIYKKKKRMPRVIAQGYNIAGGGQVPFFDFIGQGNPIAQGYNIARGGQVPFFDFFGQGNPEETASSSSLTGPPLEKENDDTEGGSSTNEKACSSEGK
ncbi:NAC domain-containing protein 41 [Dichanthelium oligosanthes]|uniref:NAC domain-containing protein 41 n=1 Tax=Dichanthelium oligosanthes TaxID=888268 RepID=A0A1E5VDA0_9POAL|nr:NAC domain-containing protein 41 [Dichanthelium oligosanthes]